MNKYSVEVIGSGGEYCFGFVKDEETKDFLLCAANNGSLNLYNDDDISFSDYTDILSAYGPDLMETPTIIVTDKNTGNEVYNSSDRSYNSFSLDSPCLDDAEEIKEKYDAYEDGDIIFGGVDYVKGLSCTFEIETEEFKIENLCFGLTDMSEVIDSSNIITNFYYISKEQREVILKTYYGDGEEDDFDEAIQELYYEEDETLKDILEKTELNIDDFTGESQGGNAILFDTDFDRIYG